jgi:hypothetical protein
MKPLLSVYMHYCDNECQDAQALYFFNIHIITYELKYHCHYCKTDTSEHLLQED